MDLSLDKRHASTWNIIAHTERGDAWLRMYVDPGDEPTPGDNGHNFIVVANEDLGEALFKASLAGLLGPEEITMVDAEWTAEIAKDHFVRWEKRKAEAQEFTTRTIGDEDCKRVPWDGAGPCGDCGVMPGQLHVPFCDLEPCPKCGAQAITCEHAIGGV
jgi:hypothetical protein